ncbi:MAG TPA: TerB family tellurite resistance protein, partial [Polyangiaceae bacterium]|nr:TerB family tellurite resistance protein [Polyangiaceae bacterium]
DAGDDTVRIVAAVAGLMGTVAYADRKYTASEEERIRAELRRVESLSQEGIDAICGALRDHIVEIATVEAPIYARELLQLADRDFRREVLDALIDVAAADDEIVLAETNSMRLTVTALGLTQADYNESQARHREKLRSLKK